MKKTIVTSFMIIFMLIYGSAFGGVYTFAPNPSNVYNLDHYYYYLWSIDSSGLEAATNSGEQITSATLTFQNIYNHDNYNFDLWVYQLDYVGYSIPAGGVYSIWDGTSTSDSIGSNYLNVGEKDLLVHYDKYGSVDSEGVYSSDTINSLYEGPSSVTYSFNTTDLANMLALIDGGSFGIGFDPDCHFYNDGILLTVNTGIPGTPVPEPSTLLLLGMGLIGVTGIGRIRRKK